MAHWRRFIQGWFGRYLLVLLFVLFCLPPSIAHAKKKAKKKGKKPKPSAARKFEKEVFAALNELRQDPSQFITELEALKKRFEGMQIRRSKNTLRDTREGTAAIDEAIALLTEMEPLPPLELSPQLKKSARLLASQQRSSNTIGHVGIDGSTVQTRIQQYGRTTGKFGEAISYGDYASPSARDVIVNLIVDDGVPDRGHRKLLLDPTMHQVGISCGKHPSYHKLCVIDFAEAVVPK